MIISYFVVTTIDKRMNYFIDYFILINIAHEIFNFQSSSSWMETSFKWRIRWANGENAFFGYIHTFRFHKFIFLFAKLFLPWFRTVIALKVNQDTSDQIINSFNINSTVLTFNYLINFCLVLFSQYNQCKNISLPDISKKCTSVFRHLRNRKLPRENLSEVKTLHNDFMKVAAATTDISSLKNSYLYSQLLCSDILIFLERSWVKLQKDSHKIVQWQKI